MWFEILVVVLLVLVNGYFAMSELALVSSRKGELQRLSAKGRRGAQVALELIADPTRMLSAVQIGITLVSVVAGAYSGATLGRGLGALLEAHVPALGDHAQQVAMVLVVGVTTYLSLVVGELVPKRLALHHAEAIAAFVAPSMRALARAGGPVVWFLGRSTETVLRLLGLRVAGSRTVTEDEVRALIAEGALAGVFAPEEKEMLDRVLRLADRTVGSIMTPRPDVVWLDCDRPMEVLAGQILASHHSRFPVASGSLDELAGILDTRDLMRATLEGGAPGDIAALVREPVVVHENTHVPRLLDSFRQTGAAMAVVLDEYGGLEGIVTLTDILEAIAGELPSDQDDPAAVRRDDGSWLLDGSVGVAEVESLTGLSELASAGNFHSLAGFLLARLHHLPTVGEHVEWQGWRLEVVDMDGRRIDRVLVSPPPPSSPPSQETSDSGV